MLEQSGMLSMISKQFFRGIQCCKLNTGEAHLNHSKEQKRNKTHQTTTDNLKKCPLWSC